MHSHSAADDCTEACPDFDATSWKCGLCGRHRAMAADTEDWPVPLCDECFSPMEFEMPMKDKGPKQKLAYVREACESGIEYEQRLLKDVRNTNTPAWGLCMGALETYRAILQIIDGTGD